MACTDPLGKAPYDKQRRPAPSRPVNRRLTSGTHEKDTSDGEPRAAVRDVPKTAWHGDALPPLLLPAFPLHPSRPGRNGGRAKTDRGTGLGAAAGILDDGRRGGDAGSGRGGGGGALGRRPHRRISRRDARVGPRRPQALSGGGGRPGRGAPPHVLVQRQVLQRIEPVARAGEDPEAFHARGGRRGRARHARRPRGAVEFALPFALYRAPHRSAEVARRRPVELRRSGRGRASFLCRLSRRRAVGRERNDESLVGAGEGAPRVPPTSGGAPAGHGAERDLRRSRLLAALKDKARTLGFSACGVAAALPPPQARARLSAWLGENAHGDMDWMAETFARRADPRALMQGAKSLVMVGMNYGPGQDPFAILRQRDKGRSEERR